MKTNAFVNIFFLFFFLTCFANCDDDDDKLHYITELTEEDKGKRIIDNRFGIKFFYIDENGSDLINLDDKNTYPISYYKETDVPLKLIDDADVSEVGYYNRGDNAIFYDDNEDLYYCVLSVYADGNHTYSYPVYVNGTVDWMKATFMYSYIDGLSGWGTRYIMVVTALEYEGLLLYVADTDNIIEEQSEMRDKKVFIKRGFDGSRTVSFTR